MRLPDALAGAVTALVILLPLDPSQPPPTLSIPLNPFLIGAHPALQTVVLDVGLGSNLFFTNGTDFYIRTN